MSYNWLALNTHPTQPIATLDSGLSSGAWNAAYDRAGLAGCASGAAGPLLRFHCSLPTASIGRHQAVDRELRVDYCADRGIGIARRASGGGALYLDENQQGISLILPRPPQWDGWDSGRLLEVFCRALALGLSRLGVHAAFKTPNDLEINGRKLASAFLAAEGNVLLLHATVLLDADIRTMLETLRVPTEKLSPSGLDSARERLVTLKEALGVLPDEGRLQAALLEGLEEGLDLRFASGIPPFNKGGLGGISTPQSFATPVKSPPIPFFQKGGSVAAAIAHSIDWRTSGAETLEAVWKTPGGTLRGRVEFDGAQIRRAEFAGDIHLLPAERLTELQQALAGVPAAAAGEAVSAFFRVHPADMLGFAADDLRRVLQLALDKAALRQTLGLDAKQASSLMIYSPDPADSAQSILDRATVMLVPYCAKPAWCKWRFEDDCTECGKCEVGDAYRLARERSMRVTTVTRYEHLVATLDEMKAAGTPAYVGMCCGSFFIKRHRAFSDAGMATVLMDISGANCYELKQEDQAYAGTFQAEAKLDVEVLRRVMKKVPGRGVGEE